jgi:hypothetical protein
MSKQVLNDIGALSLAVSKREMSDNLLTGPVGAGKIQPAVKAIEKLRR